MNMILSPSSLTYFSLLNSKVSKAMAAHHSETPYFVENDSLIDHYEMLRKVWLGGVPIKQSCLQHSLSRSTYYEIEERFIGHGVAGLFPLPAGQQEPALEQLTLIVKECHPSVSQIAVLRVAQAVPVTQEVADSQLISKILISHGYGYAAMQSDREFWARIQRSLSELQGVLKSPGAPRKRNARTDSFFSDTDLYHNRLECFRELFYNRTAKVQQTCLRLNIPMSSYYRMANEYRLYGP